MKEYPALTVFKPSRVFEYSRKPLLSTSVNKLGAAPALKRVRPLNDELRLLRGSIAVALVDGGL